MTRYLVLAFSVVLLLSATTVRAEIYSYVDANGTTHFVDDPGKIPKKLHKKKRVVDAAPGEAAPNATGVRVVGNQVLVPATLHYNGNTVQGTFLIDTGATNTTVSEVLAKRLGIRLDSGRVVVGQVAGGGLLAAMRVRLDRMDVGPKTRTDMEVDVMRHNGPPVLFDGLLGMNFLRNYHYVIDFGSGLIRWQ